MSAKGNSHAIIALLVGATIWGLLWYPYRVLQNAGVSPTLAVTLTYFVAFILGLVVLRRRLKGELSHSISKGRFPWMLILIALAAGACNTGYVLATVHGVVMRVMLLFYLAPLWTILLSRLLLGERLNLAGAGVIALSLTGAVVMLWQPNFGVPLPENTAEWLGLMAGFFFALTNVLIRKTTQLSIELKSMAVFAGGVTIALFALPFESAQVVLPNLSNGLEAWTMLLIIGVILLSINLVVQYGLSHTSANQAIVIFLFELVVAAISSWLLAGELMGLKEWIGGVMIVAGSIFSGSLEADSNAKLKGEKVRTQSGPA